MIVVPVWMYWLVIVFVCLTALLLIIDFVTFCVDYHKLHNKKLHTYKVIWYVGSVENIDQVIKETKTKAKNIDEVNFLSILPEEEKECYKANIKYCLRTILFSDDLHTIDYGSHSKFIWIERMK